ncbi:MAG TPA: apolipoprotein N-acyltransferase [Thermoanaerobaculia bacterium]
MRPEPRKSSRWATPAAAVVSGLLFALAFPPLGWVLLLPLSLAPWLVALRREESAGRALLSGFLFGLAYWCASIPWIVYVVTHYGGQSPALGVISLVILAAILAEWPALVAWATVRAAPAGSGWRLAVFPLLWMASEHLRSFVYKGFPWNLTAHALYGHPIWLQTASVWGAFGVGALVITVTALLAAAISRSGARPLAFAAALALAAGGYGAWRLARPLAAGHEAQVVLLQPNLTEEGRMTAEGAVSRYETVLEQADAAIAEVRESPSLLLIPESSLPTTWERSPRLRRDLTALTRVGSSILFNDVDEVEDGRYYNAARLLTPDGLANPAYHKVHLVPFGEYVPLPRVFFFVRRISQTTIGEFSAADEPAVLRGGPFAIGVGICYEIIYPSVSRREVEDGANLLATISNDSWYGRAGAQEQHFAGAVLRAVENERDLVRAAITGISGIVDARGRILAKTPADERTILSGRVHLREETTAWTRWGFWIPRAADVLALAVLLFGLARWGRTRRLAASGPAATKRA